MKAPATWALQPVALLAGWQLQEHQRTAADGAASLAAHEQAMDALSSARDSSAAPERMHSDLGSALRRSQLLHLARLEGELSDSRRRLLSIEQGVTHARDACAASHARVEGLERLRRAAIAERTRNALRREEHEADGLWLARRRWAHPSQEQQA